MMSSDPSAADGSFGSAVTGPSWSTAFDVLTDEHRRIALVYLVNEGRVELAELLDHVARETGRGEADRERVELLFHHNHLPKLDAVGLIEFDRDEAVVSSTPAAQQLLDRLGLLDGE